ncbi:FAS1-like dehydratase domain-containing protein [Halegenticoccus soli]|uniref:FAS1-like dehydratase domain-containing protein n=1 Tax=Halegenticoccus soli TaxID=1985678 RepID=UPI00117AE709|nr:MaoC family dehydratase N-terminal domain-containing protein [Halegenticoccus soli]
MAPTDIPTEGDVLTYARTFTEAEVREFADLSNDCGEHHVEPDENGRLVVHGLLTATLPTKIGGDLDVLARSMTFEFHRPVYAGETIACEVTIERVEESAGRADLDASVVCRNGAGEEVLTGAFDGVILG